MIDPESIPRLTASRHDRGGAAGLHAWPLAQRRVHHPRRGAEHDARADEDVPDPPGLRLQDRRHRRRHPDRPAAAASESGCRSSGRSSPSSTTCTSPPDLGRRRAAPAGRATSSTPTSAGTLGTPARQAAPEGSPARAGRATAPDPAGAPRGAGSADECRGRQRVGRRGRRDCAGPVARFVLDELGINPLAELSILLVDVDAMTDCTSSGWTSPVRPT